MGSVEPQGSALGPDMPRSQRTNTPATSFRPDHEACVQEVDSAELQDPEQSAALEPHMPPSQHTDTPATSSQPNDEPYMSWIRDTVGDSILYRLFGRFLFVLGWLNLATFWYQSRADVSPMYSLACFFSLFSWIMCLHLRFWWREIQLNGRPWYSKVALALIPLSWILVDTFWLIRQSVVMPDRSSRSFWLMGNFLSDRRCQARVSSKQAPLFMKDTYNVGHPIGQESVWFEYSNGFLSGKILFDHIRHNQTLCGQSFIGNTDFYGLGVCVGVFLQWIALILANNLLPDSYKALRNSHIVFSLAVCIVTLVSTVSNGCIFDIEVEIFYWTYLGGFLCAFAFSPSSERLESESQWVGIDFFTALHFTTHIIVVYHVIWYLHYPRHTTIAQLPCGTYHFFFAKILDPSDEPELLSAYLILLTSSVLFPLALILPILALILLSEVRKSVRESYICEWLLPNLDDLSNSQPQATVSRSSIVPSLGIQLLQAIKIPCGVVRRIYGKLRQSVGLPSNSRNGIRLTTPMDIEKIRTYRIRCAVFALLSWILSVTAIETILKWNKVAGVYTLNSTGQYMPLIIGVMTVLYVCCQIVQEEARRRHNLQCPKISSQENDNVKLRNLANTRAGADQHVSGQPDAGVISNDGTNPGQAVSENNDEVDDVFEPSSSPQSTREDYLMSGAV